MAANVVEPGKMVITTKYLSMQTIIVELNILRRSNHAGFK